MKYFKEQVCKSHKSKGKIRCGLVDLDIRCIKKYLGVPHVFYVTKFPGFTAYHMAKVTCEGGGIYFRYYGHVVILNDLLKSK